MSSWSEGDDEDEAEDDVSKPADEPAGKLAVDPLTSSELPSDIQTQTELGARAYCANPTRDGTVRAACNPMPSPGENTNVVHAATNGTKGIH